MQTNSMAFLTRSFATAMFVLMGLTGSWAVGEDTTKMPGSTWDRNTGARVLQAEGITGSGVKIGLIEFDTAADDEELPSGLPWTSHDCLSSRLVSNGQAIAAQASYHATAIAACLVGWDPLPRISPSHLYAYAGMAPNANLYCREISGLLPPGWLQVGDHAAELQGEGCGVINMSFATRSDYLCVPEMNATIDHIVDEDKVTIVSGTGNLGYNGVYNIGSPANAYNTIAVGTLSSDSSSMTGPWTSSAELNIVGPTAGDYHPGRCKPDIMAPGDYTATPKSLDENMNDEYVDWSDANSSMATPQVSGAVALLIQAARDAGLPFVDTNGRVDPRAIKSALLTAAGKSVVHNGRSWTNGGPAHPLDPALGAGGLDVEEAYLVMLSQSSTDAPVVRRGLQMDTLGYPETARWAIGHIDTPAWLTATLVWNAHYEEIAQTVDLNNLDLYLLRNGQRVNGWESTSLLDNVEHLYVRLEPGDYDLEIMFVTRNSLAVAREPFAISYRLVSDVPSAPIPPTIEIVSPSSANQYADTLFAIRWTDTDPDSNAEITLFYDTDTSYSGDEPIIDNGLPEDPDGPDGDSYLWNTSGVADGTYYIGAIIDDGVHPPVVDYSAGTVRVNHPDPASNFSVASAIPEDEGDDADEDGVIEGGETIDYTITLNNWSSHKWYFVHADLTTSTPGVTVLQNQVVYGDMLADTQASGDGHFSFDTDPGFTGTVQFTLRINYQSAQSGASHYYEDESLSVTILAPGTTGPSFSACGVEIVGGGDGDSRLESGETGWFKVSLLNTGNAGAVNVRGVLRQMQIGGQDIFSSTSENYPDIGVNQCLADIGSFKTNPIPVSFAGEIAGVMDVYYGLHHQYSQPVSFSVEVEPVPRMYVGPEAYEFGVATPGTPLSIPITITNSGSGSLTVSAVNGDGHADLSFSGITLPATVSPGTPTTFYALIDTTALQGRITRTITVEGNAYGDPSDTVTISGTVSNAPPEAILTGHVPGGGTGPNIDGMTMVFLNSSGGSAAIYTMDLCTGTYTQRLTGGLKSQCKISGDYVVFTEGATNTNSSELYLLRLSTGVLTRITNNALNDFAPDISGDYVVWEQTDRNATFTLLDVYKYRISTDTTEKLSLVPDSSENDINAWDGYAVWHDKAGRGIWRHSFSTGVTTRMWTYSSISGNPRIGPAGIAWSDEVGPDESAEVFLNGGQITATPMREEWDVAVGTNYLVYYVRAENYHLYAYNTTTGIESLASFDENGKNSISMEGNIAYWDDGANVHAVSFNPTPDIVVLGQNITCNLSPVVDGQPMTLQCLVQNTGAVSASNVSVQFFWGDPSAGGIPIATPQIIPALASGSSAAVSQPATFQTSETVQVYVRAFITGCVFEDVSSNIAFREFTVIDDDPDPPSLILLSVEEEGGDGDGDIEDNEQMRITWQAQDPSGIAATSCAIDGTSYPALGTYYVIAGPLPAGHHDFTIEATDADNSPETATLPGWFEVFPHAPAVISTMPTVGATDVSRLPEIVATFNTNLDPTTVTSAAMLVKDASQALVSGSVTYNSTFRQVAFLPVSELINSRVYTVTLVSGPDGIRDSQGREMDADYTWSFTVEPDADMPTAIISAPIEGTSVTGTVAIFGSAWDRNFADYQLLYGVGPAPTEWTPIGDPVTTPKTSEVLGMWDTSVVQDGVYTIRLVVRDAPPALNASEDTVTVLCGVDCNANGVPDSQDLATGFSSDCNSNGAPDECDVDFLSGSMLQFDGSDDVVLSTFSWGTPKNDFTIEAWVKAEQPHEIDPESTSGTAGTSGQRYLWWPYCGTPPDAIMGLSVGTNGVSVYEHAEFYLPATAVYAGELGTNWHHIAVTYTNKQPRIFVDGTLANVGLQSPRANVFASPVLGGGMYGYFPGQLDEVRVWDRARTETQIAANMYRAVARDEPGLVAYWRFNEAAAAQLAVDSSVQGNDAGLGLTLDPENSDPVRIASTIPTVGTGSHQDCNENGVPDECDIANAGSGFVDASSWTAYDPGGNGVGAQPDGYSGAVCDGRYVYFVPYHGGDYGEVMRYDTGAGFASASSWQAYNPGLAGVGVAARGYDGAIFDGRYIYFAPIYNDIEYHGEVLRYDTAHDFSLAASWTAYNPGLNGVGVDPNGYVGGTFDGRYVYFAPHRNGTEYHGEVLRYDTTADFSTASSWTTFDPGAQGVGNDPDGYQGAIYDGRYVFFVPYYNGSAFHGEVLRYDTAGAFSDTASWFAYDPGANGVGLAPDGYRGAAFDGRFIYFSPMRRTNGYHGEVLRYDTSGDFTAAASWATFDAGANGIGTDPDGYTGALFDGRFVYFVPYHNGTQQHGEVLRYDSTGAFSEVSSWSAFDAGNNGVGTAPDGYWGGAFDGHRYIYFAPYHNAATPHGEVLRYDTGGRGSRDCDSNSVPDECQPDSDSDGFIDACDSCPNTIPGGIVDAEGCSPMIPGDFDRDGDVDDTDLTHFEACASGPSIPQPNPDCSNAKLDEDEDIDQCDFAVFQRCMSGSDVPGNPQCAQGGAPNQPPVITDPEISGSLVQGQVCAVVVSCTASDPDGTIESARVDLSAIGGPSIYLLVKGTGDEWVGSTNITPPSSGSQVVTFTATDDHGATGSAQATVSVGTGAVFCWGFDEAGSPYAEECGLLATATGTGTATVPGHIGNAVSLPQGQTAYVDLGIFDLPQYSGTIVMWVRPQTLSGGSSHMFVKGTNGNGPSGWSLYFNILSDGGMLVGAGLANDAYAGTAAGAVQFGVWQQLAMTWSPAGVLFYVNAQVKPTVAGTGVVQAVPNSSMPVALGKWGATYYPTAAYKGEIDELKVFDRALTGQEIAILSNTSP